MTHVCQQLGISERRACRVLQQARSAQRHAVILSGDAVRLTERITVLASAYGRYGCRWVAALLHAEGGRVNHKRVERIWRQQDLKVPKRQPKRNRLWLHDGSCVRRRAEHRDHVGSYDFVLDRT